MLLSPKNKGQKENLNGEGNDNTFMPIVGNIRKRESFLYAEIDKPDENTVQPENKHRTDGYEGDKMQTYAVKSATKVNNPEDRKGIHNIIQDDMKYKMAFVNMPVKQTETEEQGRGANEQILMKIESLEITCLLEQVSHEEETETTDKPMIGDKGSIVIKFISTIKYDTDNGEYEHYSFPMFLTIAYIGYPMHQE